MKILVSACLLGERVSYDGQVLPALKRLADAFGPIADMIPFCPEVAGGLPVPRSPSEISGKDGFDVLDGKGIVKNKIGDDVTHFYLKGAGQALETAVKNNVMIAVLKEKSPSCGNSLIYDGDFAKTLKSGRGVTATLLERNGISVFSEKEIEKALKAYLGFVGKAFLLLAFFLASNIGFLQKASAFPDAPEYPSDAKAQFKTADSYEESLKVWKTPEDINDWIADGFSYDTDRAALFSETQKSKNGRIGIYNPSEFFSIKTGVCVDLSSFAVETLKRINPDSDPKYLMIEFEPVSYKGNIYRLHWLVSFKRGGKLYFFADSKRPGHIAGPYKDTGEFINEYEKFRGRKIIDFREPASYQKKDKAKALKTNSPQKTPQKEFYLGDR